MQTDPPPVQKRLSQWELLLRDWFLSLGQWHLWMHLGWQDLLRQYRRSFLGPAWIAINTAIFTAAFGWIGAQLFNQDVKSYIPYFCLGNVFFGFLTSVFNEGCKTYIDSAAFLKQSSYPKFIFVLRVVWRNLLLLAHQIPLILIVLWIGGLLGQSLWLLWLGGMLLTVASAVMAVALLGAISTRFRDIPMVVGSILQIAFFITPVIWRPTQLSAGHSSAFIALNPLAAWLELLRAPLMGQAPQITAWMTASIAFVVLTLLCIAVYLAVRRRINYWL